MSNKSKKSKAEISDKEEPEQELEAGEIAEGVDLADMEADIDSEIDEDIEFLIDPDNITDDDEDEESESSESKIATDLEKIVEDDFEAAEDDPEPDDPDDIDEEEAPEVEADDDLEEPKNKATKVTVDATIEDWTCTSCYVKVIPAQFGSPKNPVCPQGQSLCAGIDKFFKN